MAKSEVIKLYLKSIRSVVSHIVVKYIFEVETHLICAEECKVCPQIRVFRIFTLVKFLYTKPIRQELTSVRPLQNSIVNRTCRVPRASDPGC